MEKRFIEATLFAIKKHQFQKRKGTQLPYIVHPVGVANTLAQAGVTDIDILIAAVLHDTVEDTNTTFDEIEKLFGENVVKYVREATDDKSKSKVERKKLQVEHSKTISVGGKLIKYADKICNMRDICEDNPCVFKPLLNAKGYMTWGVEVCKAFRGINEKLDKMFDEILTMNLHTEEGEVPC